MVNEIMKLICAVCAGLFGASIPTQANADQANIVFIFADDQAYDTLGPHDDPIVQTPNLDALVARGAVLPCPMVIGSGRSRLGRRMCRPISTLPALN